MQVVVKEFLTAKAGAGRCLKTCTWYEDNFNAFLAWLHINRYDDTVLSITSEAIEGFLAYEQANLQPSSVNGRYRALRAFFNWFEKRQRRKDRDYISPIRDVESPHVPRKRQRAVKMADWITLLGSIELDTWIGVRDYLAVNTLFLCGLRAAELVALRIEDYDLSAKVVIVRDGKGGDAREVPLLPPVASAFVAFLYVRPSWSTSAVFLSADGSHLKAANVWTVSGVRQRMKVLCERADIAYMNPHSFRHGIARHLLNDKGADMSLIQKILGHKRLSTTADIYAQWDDDGAKAQYQAIMSDLDKSVKRRKL